MSYRITDIQYATKQVVVHLQKDNQENKQELKLYTEVYIRQPLIIGEVIDQKRYSQYLRSNRMYDVEQTALNLISKRDLSQASFSEKMIDKYPDEKVVINQIIQRYLANGWLNDQRFGLAIVNKGMKQLHGPQRIRLALHKAGFKEEEMDKFFPLDYEEIFLENAYLLARKKLKNQKLIDEKTKKSIAFRLQAMGYPASTIANVLRYFKQIQTDELDYES